MKKTSARKLPSIKAKVAFLRRRQNDLALRIDDEMRRPVPCSVALQQLKRRRLLLKDQIARCDALLRGPHRAGAAMQAM